MRQTGIFINLIHRYLRNVGSASYTYTYMREEQTGQKMAFASADLALDLVVSDICSLSADAGTTCLGLQGKSSVFVTRYILCLPIRYLWHDFSAFSSVANFK
jgi:hypothetical protein